MKTFAGQHKDDWFVNSDGGIVPVCLELRPFTGLNVLDYPQSAKVKSKYYVDVNCSNCDERVIRSLEKPADNIIKDIKCDVCGTSYQLHIGEKHYAFECTLSGTHEVER